MSDRLRFFEPHQIRAAAREGGVGLRVEIVDDRTVLNAQVRRAFPLSRETEYVSIRQGDGKEVGLLLKMEGLEEETRRLFEHELDRRYFTPTISRIHEMKQEAGMWRFNVDTQRGPVEFFVRNWRDNAFELTAGRWFVQSVDGGRFEIEDVEALDERSRRLMDQVL